MEWLLWLARVTSNHHLPKYSGYPIVISSSLSIWCKSQLPHWNPWFSWSHTSCDFPPIILAGSSQSSLLASFFFPSPSLKAVQRALFGLPYYFCNVHRFSMWFHIVDRFTHLLYAKTFKCSSSTQATTSEPHTTLGSYLPLPKENTSPLSNCYLFCLPHLGQWATKFTPLHFSLLHPRISNSSGALLLIESNPLSFPPVTLSKMSVSFPWIIAGRSRHPLHTAARMNLTRRNQGLPWQSSG